MGELSAMQASRELDSWKMGSDGVAKGIGTRRDRNTYVIGGKIFLEYLEWAETGGNGLASVYLV